MLRVNENYQRALLQWRRAAAQGKKFDFEICANTLSLIFKHSTYSFIEIKCFNVHIHFLFPFPFLVISVVTLEIHATQICVLNMSHVNG